VVAGSLEVFTFGWKRCPFVNFGILFEWICHLFKAAASYFSYEAKLPGKKQLVPQIQRNREKRGVSFGKGGGSSIEWFPKNTSAEV